MGIIFKAVFILNFFIKMFMVPTSQLVFIQNFIREYTVFSAGRAAQGNTTLGMASLADKTRNSLMQLKLCLYIDLSFHPSTHPCNSNRKTNHNDKVNWTDQSKHLRMREKNKEGKKRRGGRGGGSKTPQSLHFRLCLETAEKTSNRKSRVWSPGGLFTC